MNHRPVDHEAVWEENLPAELRHWERWMAGEVGHGPAVRLAPDYGFPHTARKLLDAPEGATVRVLDLGSGPASTVGTHWPGRTVRLTCVDPLADDYNALLRRHGFDAFATIVKGAGETLLSDVAGRDFDLVYSGNAFDHAYDPILAIRNMVEIARPGGWVSFMVRENEAEAQSYHGLHQWNFCVRDGTVVLWTGEGEWDVSSAIANATIVEAVTARDVPGKPRVSVAIRKDG